MKKIKCEHPEMQQIFGRAIWNEEKGLWEVSLLFTEARYCLGGDYRMMESSFEAEVSACDEFVLPAAMIQAKGFNAEEIISGSIVKNLKEF